MTVATHLTTTIINQTIGRALEVCGWDLDATAHVMADLRPRGPGRAINGWAVRRADGIGANLSTARLTCDEYGKNTMIKIVLRANHEPIEVECPVAIAVVGHIVGAYQAAVNS